MRFAAILALLSVAAGPAFAAPPAPPPQTDLPPSLVQALARPDHVAALLRAAHAVDPPGMPACPAANYTTTGEVGVLDPLQTDGKGQVTGGAIKESMRQTGCGPDRLLNALTVIQPDGTLQTSPLLPGNTITDPQLQQDSVPFAAGALGQMPAGCEQGGVVNTRSVGVDGAPPGTRPLPGAPPRPWTEVWTLQACAKHADVTIHFSPDPTGTEIRADPVAP
jgi:hypothetical protein